MSTSLSRCGGKYHLGNEEDEGEEDEGEEAEAEDEAEEDEEDVGFHQDSEEEGRSSTTPPSSTTTSSSTTYETSTWITTTETSTCPLSLHQEPRQEDHQAPLQKEQVSPSLQWLLKGQQNPTQKVLQKEKDWTWSLCPRG